MVKTDLCYKVTVIFIIILVTTFTFCIGILPSGGGGGGGGGETRALKQSDKQIHFIFTCQSTVRCTFVNSTIWCFAHY